MFDKRLTGTGQKHLIISLALVALTLVPYLQVHNYSFVYLDDYDYIVENHHINRGLTHDGLIWAFNFQQNDKSYWRPLTWVSHMLDFELFGSDPGWHHLVNLLFHLLNILLLYAFLFKTTGRFFRSALVALLFGLHPINVESVAWITERNNVLCTTVGLITLWLYARYASQTSLRRFLYVFLAFLLCLMVKPILVTLPFLMLLLDYWPLGRYTHHTERNSSERHTLGVIIGEKIPLIILTILAIGFSLQRHGSTVSMAQVPLPMRLANGIVSYVKYLLNLFYPTNLTAFYPYPEAIPAWQLFGSIVVLLCISVICVLWIRRFPYLFVGWFWFAGTMFPKIGLIQVGLWPALADRWAYFPAIGIFLIVSWALFEIAERQPGHRYRRFLWAVLPLCVVMVVLTWRQVRYWENSKVLFSRMVTITRHNFMAHNNLGLIIKEEGNQEEALSHFQKAIEINPGFEIAYLNLGKMASDSGDIDRAIECYEKAIAIRPSFYGAHIALGNLLLKTNALAEAWQHYSEAIRIKPDAAAPYNGLASVLTKLGRLKEAKRMFEKALSIEPDYGPSKQNLERVVNAIQAAQPDSDQAIGNSSED
jgi:tetratricopeptide (TPR) repeat protein